MAFLTVLTARPASSILPKRFILTLYAFITFPANLASWCTRLACFHFCVDIVTDIASQTRFALFIALKTEGCQTGILKNTYVQLIIQLESLFASFTLCLILAFLTRPVAKIGAIGALCTTVRAFWALLTI